MAQDAGMSAPSTAFEAPAAPAPPAIKARAAVMIDASDGQVLFSLNPDERLAMASTTKMMTALLIVENHRDEMDRILTCSTRAAEVGESSIWLTEGEKLTLREMLTGLLVQSGNDAAITLAEFHAGSVEAFAERMNERAVELGMENTRFANPHGLDEEGHYSSATDLVKLGREVMKHPEIREIVKMEDVLIPWAGHPHGRTLVNHNHLLGLDPSINGIKTGFTDAAGQCIVISASEGGTDLIVAYLGGPNISQRDEDVLNLIRFGFDSYREMTVINDGVEYASVDLPYYSGRKLALVSDGSLTRKLFLGNKVERRLILPDKMQLPIHKGDKIGLVEAYEGNRYLGSTWLVAMEEVAAPSLKEQVSYYVATIFTFLFSVLGSG